VKHDADFNFNSDLGCARVLGRACYDCTDQVSCQFHVDGLL